MTVSEVSTLDIGARLHAPPAGDALTSVAFLRSPCPAFIIDAHRKLEEMNFSGARLHAVAFAADVAGRLLVGRAAADQALASCVETALDRRGSARTALKLADGRMRGLLFQDLADGDHVLMTVNLPFDERSCEVGVLAQAYGLTPAEVRLMGLLLTGMPPKAAAAKVCASLHTVRTQIRSILLKSESPSLQVLLAKAAQLL